MFDNTHAHEFISEEETVKLDQDDGWVHEIYRRHLKPKGSKEIPVEVARQLIMDEIEIRCINLETFYKNNSRPAKPFQERVQLVVTALETLSYNESSI